MATLKEGLVVPGGLACHPDIKLIDAAVWAFVDAYIAQGAEAMSPVDTAASFGVPPWIIHEAFLRLEQAGFGKHIKVGQFRSTRLAAPSDPPPEDDQAEAPAPSPPPPEEEPPPAEEPDHRHRRRTAAINLIDVVRQVCGRREVRPTPERITMVLARLDEVAFDVDGVERMIRRQADVWSGTDMEQYLRVETLFRKSKFMNYYEWRDVPVTKAKAAVAEPRASFQQVQVRKSVTL